MSEVSVEFIARGAWIRFVSLVLFSLFYLGIFYVTMTSMVNVSAIAAGIILRLTWFWTEVESGKNYGETRLFWAREEA